MAALVLQQIGITAPGGVFPITATQTFVTPDAAGTELSGGNTAPPDDRGFLEFENTGTAKLITVYVPASAGADEFGFVFPNITYTLAATTGRHRVPLLPQLAQPSDGLIHFTVDVNTGVTCAAIRR
jgi:hypothetical protein